MDISSLLQIWDKTPLWLKIDLVIIQFAALWTAIMALLPILRWILMRVKMLRDWLALEERWIWLRHKPKVTLKSNPSIAISKIEGTPRIKYIAKFTLEFKGRDIELTEIGLENIEILIWSGYGKRRKRTVFSFASEATYSDKNFRLGKEVIAKDFCLEGFGNQATPAGVINFHKTYKWEIVGIQAKVFNIKSKSPRSFKGKSDLQIL